ncbi:hypothetical protein VM99_10370 [Pseudomonas chlororaphis]|uniref:Uncharacterized protein n=1 Tax=Pseudomonas chlororaphis TaxID=587753 RepID=A0A0G3GI23_9PSED|nr:hypothetical protein [Pseudomonas sp. P97.38]AKJ98446.1 hypothetical protein VM99_10370 [Pseudomonas chlororaphis]
MDLHEVKKLGGVITFDDISCLDQSVGVAEISNELKEDLFQASFPFEQIIDIGWYPEFCESGFFRVSLILECNWDAPVYSEEAKDWVELAVALTNTLKKVRLA